MSKQTRAEKKAEEARIIAEMEGAMGNVAPAEQTTEDGENQRGKYASNVEKIHCKRCKAVMEKGVCPVCGFRVYTPMDEGKRKKIRIIVAAVSILLFVGLFLILRLT